MDRQDLTPERKLWIDLHWGNVVPDQRELKTLCLQMLPLVSLSFGLVLVGDGPHLMAEIW